MRAPLCLCFCTLRTNEIRRTDPLVQVDYVRIVDLDIGASKWGICAMRVVTNVGRFDDRRLERRPIYYESPHLFEEADRCAIAEDIAFRRRGEGKDAFPPWTTIARA
jgi:hypothetical protein